MLAGMGFNLFVMDSAGTYAVTSISEDTQEMHNHEGQPSRSTKRRMGTNKDKTNVNYETSDTKNRTASKEPTRSSLLRKYAYSNKLKILRPKMKIFR